MSRYEILNWMPSNRRTPTQRRKDRINLVCNSKASSSNRVGSEIISPSSSVRDLSTLTPIDDGNARCAAAGCFPALHQIWSVRRSLPLTTIKALAVSMVLSDQTMATQLWQAFQGVFCAVCSPSTARIIIVGPSRSAHISTRLVNRSAVFKARLLATFLHADFILVADAPLIDVPTRRRLRLSLINGLIVRPSRVVTVGDRAFPVANTNLTNSLHCSLDFLSGILARRFCFVHHILIDFHCQPMRLNRIRSF